MDTASADQDSTGSVHGAVSGLTTDGCKPRSTENEYDCSVRPGVPLLLRDRTMVELCFEPSGDVVITDVQTRKPSQADAVALELFRFAIEDVVGIDCEELRAKFQPTTRSDGPDSSASDVSGSIQPSPGQMMMTYPVWLLVMKEEHRRRSSIKDPYSQRRPRMRTQKFKLSSTSPEVLLKLADDIIAIRRGRLPDAPRHLRVFVNPRSGKGRGQHVLENIVVPLFTIAGISTEISFTTHAGHADELACEENLETYDGRMTVIDLDSFV